MLGYLPVTREMVLLGKCNSYFMIKLRISDFGRSLCICIVSNNVWNITCKIISLHELWCCLMYELSERNKFK